MTKLPLLSGSAFIIIMSAIGASVTMKALTLGVIVNRMIVYGLVLSIEMRDRCKLLQLVMDYDHMYAYFMNAMALFRWIY